MEDHIKICIMVKGTIFSFVVAAIFFLCYILTFNPVYAVLSIFMALFGGVLVLLNMKEKADENVEYEEDEDLFASDEEEQELNMPIAAVA